MDIVLCRNVLIYFDRATQDRAIVVLKRLLKPKGVLFVAPAETGLPLSHDFVSSRKANVLRCAFETTTPARPRPSRSAVPVRAGTSATVRAYTIQIAALVNEENARALTAELKRAGFAAYLVVPPPDGDALYRVRVGHYASRVAAQTTVDHLEQRLGLKLWVTRTR